MNASEGGRTALVNAPEPENGPGGRLGTRRTALMSASEGGRTALVNASERENGSGEHLQQTLIINTLQQQTRLTTASTSDAVVALLEGFDIDPASAKGKQILELSPPPNVVRAWMLYAVSSKRQLRNPQGFVIMRLLSEETPPTRFITYAGLTEEQWIGLTLASSHGRRYLPTLDTPVDLDTWREDFAGVFRSSLSRVGLLLPDDSQMPRSTPPPTDSGLWTEWEKVLRNLRLQMTEATFETHLAQATAERSDGRLIVWAANDRSRAWLDCRLRAIIERTVHRLCGEELPVDFRVQEGSTGSEAG